MCAVSTRAQAASSEPLEEGNAVKRRRAAAILEENGTLVVIVAAFAAALVADVRHELVADGWMALLSGREIVSHGLPSHDVLTVWAHGRRWVDQQWLAQLLLYGLERLGGIRLVMLVHAFVASGALVTAATLARRLGGSARSVTWICLPVLVVYFPGAAVMRPQSLTFILFAALLWLLLTDERRPSRRVFVTLPLLVLWANLHGSVILAAAVVSAYGLVRVVLASRAKPRRLETRAAVLLLVPWACVFASPYATHLPGYYRQILFAGGFGRYVTEWAATTLTPLNAPLYLLVIGGAWLVGRSGGGVSTFEKLLFFGTGILAFEAVRNMVWFALVAVVVLPRLVDTLRPAVNEPKTLNRLLAIAMLCGLVVATGAVAANSTSWFLSDYPPSAANAAAAAAGKVGKVFANERYADWLIWTHPDLRGRVAFDSRFELLRRSELQAIVDFRNRVGNWQSIVRGYRVLVLDPQDERKVRYALLRARSARVVTANIDVVVLRSGLRG